MARGVTEYGSFNDWLKAPAPGKGGGGSQYLKDWKKDGEVDTWLHPKRLPLVVWRHPFPNYVVVEDKKTKEKVKHVYTQKGTCHEGEEVLEALYWRDKETGQRKHPPQRCGHCKFNEWLYQQAILWLETHTWDPDEKAWKEIKAGKGKGIDPCKAAFRFKSEHDDTENVTLHVGGMCGLFGKKDPPEDLTLAMRAAKIKGTEVWKENTTVKAESVLCVVKNANPGLGVVVAIETKALGEKVKEQIVKTYKSVKRDIQKNPYCIKWEFDKDADFDKKYDATALLDVPMSPRIKKLLKGPPPDLTNVKTPFNQQTMRARMEQYCLLKNVPWDKFFPSKEQEAKWAKEDEEESKASEEEEDVETEDESDEEEMFECDECEKPMKASDKKCPHCGHKYDVEGKDDSDDEDEDDEDEEEDEDEKPVKKKSSAKTSSKSKKKSDEDEEEEDEDDDSDEEDDSDDEDEEEEDEEEEKPVKKKSSAKPAAKSKKKAAEEDEDEDEEEEDEDDSDDEEEDEDEEEEEEEKPVKKKASSKKSSAKASSKSKKKSDDDDDDDDDNSQDDEIPF